MRREDIKDFFKRLYDCDSDIEDENVKLLTEQTDEDAAAEGGEVEEDAEEAAEEGDEEAGVVTPDDQDPEQTEELDSFKSSFDDQLNAIFVDIESGAIESAQSQQENFSLKQVLLSEAEDTIIDIQAFASEIARIINNIEIFIDIEETVLERAKEYLLDKYDDKALVDEFEEVMSSNFDIVSADNEETEEYEDANKALYEPIAVGAMSGGGGGGGV